MKAFAQSITHILINKTWISLLGLSAIMSFWTLYFGAPFYHEDSSYYLHFSREGLHSSDIFFRPIFYSIFLGALKSHSVAVFVQSFWLVTLLYFSLRKVNTSKHFSEATILFACIATSVSFVSNFTLPDIFVSIQILSFYLLLSEKELKPIVSGALIFSYWIGSVMHYSNSLLAISMLGLLLFQKKYRQQRKKWLVLLFPFLFLPMSQFALGKGRSLYDASHVFLFSRLIAHDISQPYILKRCKQENLEICRVPHEGFQIWDWSEDGPIAKMGGLQNIKQEIIDANYDVLTDVSGFSRFVIKSLINSGKQLMMIGGYQPPLVSRNVSHSKMVFNKQAHRYQWSHFEYFIESFWSLIVLLSAILIVFFYKNANRRHRELFQFLFSAIVLNAFICGSLTEPMARYQSRILWMLPTFCFLLFLITVKKHQKKKQKA